jgi:hypothetical protein
VQWTCKAANSGIVHQDVQASEFLLDASSDRLDGVKVCQITDRYFGLSACSGYAFRGGLQVFLGTAAKHGHDAQIGKPGGYRGSDPAPCTRYYGYLSEESSILIPFLEVLCCGQFSLLKSLLTYRPGEPGGGGADGKAEPGLSSSR